MDAEGVNNINQDLYNSLCQVEDPDPTVVTIGLKGLMKCMEIAVSYRVRYLIDFRFIII